MSAHALTRRTMLRGALVAGAFAAASPITPATAATAPGTPAATRALTLSDFVTAKTFDVTWSTETMTSFPQRVMVSGASPAFTCEAVWDTRLFDVARTILAIGDTVHELIAASSPSGAVSWEVPAGCTELLFDVRGRTLYPHENIGAAARTVIMVRQPGHPPLSTQASRTSTACAAWALEVEAEWTTVNQSVVPASVRLLSRGPGPVPIGTTIDVIAAVPRLPSRVRTTSRLSATVDTYDDHVTVPIVVRDAIPSGTIETLTLPFGEPDSVPRGNPSRASSVLQRMPASTTGMRLTGKTAAYPLTNAGTAVSSFARPDTIAPEHRPTGNRVRP